MLKHDKIEISISYRNVTHYQKLGYKPIINKSLLIKTTDLPSVSHVDVDVICDLCGSEKKLKYHKYVANVNRHGFYGCRNCSREKFRLTYIDKNSVGTYIDFDREKLKNAISLKGKMSFVKSEELYEDISNKNYKLYKNEVRRLSKKSINALYLNWDGYDFYDGEYIKEYLNLSHVDNRYPSVDHKISIYYGFMNGMPVEKISDISNLCITKRFINSTKRDLINFKKPIYPLEVNNTKS